MSNLKSMEWAAEHRGDPGVSLVDCRFALGKPLSGRSDYEAGHLPGAVYADLEQDLSGPKQAHGGRHPLSEWGTFVDFLESVGISNDSIVIAYDDQGGAMASRFWWMLRYLGHDRVYVMNGSYAEWVEQGYPVSTDVPSPKQGQFAAKIQAGMLLTMEDVKARLGRSDVTLLDSRDATRYLGIEDTVDPAAGHIPGAKHFFWKDALDEQGRWKTPEDQRQRLAKMAGSDASDREIVVYCGSGVTACPNVLALEEAGLANVKLYAGSWSDWCSYKDNPVATGKSRSGRTAFDSGWRAVAVCREAGCCSPFWRSHSTARRLPRSSNIGSRNAQVRGSGCDGKLGQP